MNTIDETRTREEVAALVCATLQRHGIRVVLSGGAVVSIYSDNLYESYDLDFIQMGLAKNTRAAMEELGFRKQPGRHWVHPRTRYWVEFPAGPLTVGDQPVEVFSERSTPFGVLRLLAPTECVMDRLAAFYHWGDRQCLDQAVAVAKRHAVDLEKVEAWSRRESADARFREFIRAVGPTPERTPE